MIKDLKELQTLLKLCRKQGVTEILCEGMTIKFGALPQRKNADDEQDDDDIPTDALSPEQLMFFSAPSNEGS